MFLKGFVGTQRFFFEQGPGIIRGMDAELDFNELFSFLSESKTNLLFGGSFVSRFQEDEETSYDLPENVAAYATRTTISRGKITFNSEYAYKMNDPKVEAAAVISRLVTLLYHLSVFHRKDWVLVLRDTELIIWIFDLIDQEQVKNLLYLSYPL